MHMKKSLYLTFVLMLFTLVYLGHTLNKPPSHLEKKIPVDWFNEIQINVSNCDIELVGTNEEFILMNFYSNDDEVPIQADNQNIIYLSYITKPSWLQNLLYKRAKLKLTVPRTVVRLKVIGEKSNFKFIDLQLPVLTGQTEIGDITLTKNGLRNVFLKTLKGDILMTVHKYPMIFINESHTKDFVIEGFDGAKSAEGADRHLILGGGAEFRFTAPLGRVKIVEINAANL